ncbi:glycosyltransferase [Rhodococcus kroppenstedtii]|uniref:glycosyltransferase n=1 Tax=Rhodococcoides kroppenstedtii TaxID=293050 RepID=UPI001C9A9C1E|nr:glycosyltransferase [Rhodococcus kroppenstedtii]MBY6437540.1 glycosyltransferase [Rhodococcus kroppenstedtii]
MADYYARPISTTLGGVNQSREEWIHHLAGRCAEVRVLNAARGLQTSDVLADSNISINKIGHLGKTRSTMVPIISQVVRALRDCDLLYLHEGWTLSSTIVARIASRLALPYVVKPHGVYEPEIVRTLRAVPGRRLSENKTLSEALAVHCFFSTESQSVQRLAPTARCIVAPTGFTFPDPATERVPGAEEPYLAWLGRYDVHHKGIDLLFEALARVRQDMKMKLVMVGQDYNDGRRDVDRLRAEFGLDDQVLHVRGPLPQREALDFVANSHGFIHTPRWEALGRTVVDSIGLGIPTAVARTAHIGKAMSDAGVDMTFELTVSDIGEALLALQDTAVDTARSKAWAAQHFSWDRSMNEWEKQISILFEQRSDESTHIHGTT